MNTRKISTLLTAALLSAGMMNAAQADVFITEWMYNGDEFIEFTNMGSSTVDFTGWSFDDDSRTAGTVDLSAFGIVASGESVILSEAAAATFRTAWGLAASVKIIGRNGTNLGRNDEINLYDSADTLVDRLTYGDQNIAGTIRTQDISGRPNTLSALGTNDVSQWVLSSNGDIAGSYGSTGGFIGNPGIAPVPEAETYALMLAGLGLVGFMARRRKS
jgi:hypothetical protein